MPRTPQATLLCAECDQQRPREAFTGTQIKKADRKCKDCTASAATLLCAGCDQQRPREAFTGNQIKKLTESVKTAQPVLLSVLAHKGLEYSMTLDIFVTAVQWCCLKAVSVTGLYKMVHINARSAPPMQLLVLVLHVLQTRARGRATSIPALQGP